MFQRNGFFSGAFHLIERNCGKRKSQTQTVRKGLLYNSQEVEEEVKNCNGREQKEQDRKQQHANDELERVILTKIDPPAQDVIFFAPKQIEKARQNAEVSSVQHRQTFPDQVDVKCQEVEEVEEKCEESTESPEEAHGGKRNDQERKKVQK
mmetsp:Transcript_3932/g.6005  ORF Transcript_3932/g.6005 Transcript_3932/m.6005 type:complete len:151 (+) Transcript_3932:149-601(+)